MAFPGGDMGTIVTIGGDSAGLVVAVGAAVDALTTYDASAADSAAATLDLTGALGDSAATFADIAVAAGDATATMAGLAASAADASGGVAELAMSATDGSASFAELSGSVDEAAGSMTALAASSDAAAASTVAARDSIDFTTMSIGDLTGGMGQAIGMAAAFVAAIMAWQVLNDVAGWVQNLIQQMFQLDEQTQKTVNSWQYLFQSTAGATSLAGWAYRESPNLPFTAMDLRAAISTLGTAGYSPAQIEQFIPYLADVASTLGTAAYGGQGVTLNQAAMAIRSAGFGLTRMLRTDLGISPQQLVPYGLDAKVSSSGAVRIKDMATLLPAIMNFVHGRGLYGAAQEQETKTFWGGWSSFLDYLQNFGQTVGGINPVTGDVTSGSMFGGIQNVLNTVNSILGGPSGVNVGVPGKQLRGAGGRDQILELKQAADSTTPSLADLANVLESILGGAVTSLTSAFSGLFAGMGGQGGENMLLGLFNNLKDFGNWLNSAPIQTDLRNIGKTIGEFLGQTIQAAKTVMPDLKNAFQDLGTAIGKFTGSFSPGEQNSLHEWLALIIEMIAGTVEFVANLIGAAAAIHNFATNIGTGMAQLIPNFQKWGKDMLDQLAQGIGSAIPGVLGQIMQLGTRIANLIGFSVPKEGPLSGAAQWMPDMMRLLGEGIIGGIPGLAGAMGQAAEGMFTQFLRTLEGWANYLRNRFFTWGMDFISMLAQGILSGIGQIINAANQVAFVMAARLMHSAPTVGPLVDDHLWGEHFMQQLAGSMDRGLPLVAAASNRAAAALGGPTGPAIGPLGGGLGGGTNNTWNNTLGGNATTITLVGVNGAVVLQMLRTLMTTTDQQQRLAYMAPGGFQQFGAFG